MRYTAFLATVAASALTAGVALAAEGDTLAQVKQRGVLNCGVNTGLVGFAAPDANGNWSGFDIAICKAVAAAVLGDPSKVKYIPTTGQTRFTALTSGEVDVLARNSTWTFQRDTDLKMDFAGVNYYDGQGFMVRKDLGVSSATELDASGLAATRAAFADPDNHVILPEIISKEPLGPATRHGDNNWTDIVRWTLYALVSAEEYGVTSANLDELSRSSTNPDVQRMLGTIDDYGTMLGLDKEWAKRAIAASGNYGEIFAANIGEQTPIGLPRGLNALWTQGGLMYAMPFR